VKKKRVQRTILSISSRVTSARKSFQLRLTLNLLISLMTTASTKTRKMSLRLSQTTVPSIKGKDKCLPLRI